MLPDRVSNPEMKIVEFANSVDPDEVAHNEPPHLDLYCFPSILTILSMIAWVKYCF